MLQLEFHICICIDIDNDTTLNKADIDNISDRAFKDGNDYPVEHK